MKTDNRNGVKQIEIHFAKLQKLSQLHVRLFPNSQSFAILLSKSGFGQKAVNGVILFQSLFEIRFETFFRTLASIRILVRCP